MCHSPNVNEIEGKTLIQLGNVHILCMGETWAHVSVYWQQDDYQLWANCFMLLESSSDRGPQSFKATPPPAIITSALTTRPWPVRQTRTGTSRMVSHTRHNNEPTLSRNDSPLGWLHMALMHRYIIFVWRNHEHISPCTGSRVITSYERIVLCCWNPVARS